MRRSIAFLLALLLLSACGREGADQYAPGDPVPTHWFTFTLDAVRVADSYNGYLAPAGNRLAICTLTLENTFGEEVPMTRKDFSLVWAAEGPEYDQEGAYPLEHFSLAQLDDRYILAPEETITGTVAFLVPDGVDRAAVQFIEYYADSEEGSTFSLGESYQVWFTL